MLLSFTYSVHAEAQGTSEDGTDCPHWFAAPAVQLVAPMSTPAYSASSISQVLSPASVAAGEPPVPLAPPVPGTYEQYPAVPPSVETQVVLSGAGQRMPQGGFAVPSHVDASQAVWSAKSAELSVT
jgi:hypothetical protein